MKKVMMIIALMIPITGWGATMCSKNDTITIMLDPSIEGTEHYRSTAAQSTWMAVFPYGTVRGIHACLSSNYGKSLGEYVADLHDNNELVGGGETNGEHCWCKMTHPAASLWVFRITTTSASECANVCANHCGYRTHLGGTMRSGMFESIRQQ